MKIVYSVMFIILGGYLADIAYADDCTPIRFHKGSYSGTVSGVAEFSMDSGPVCYTIGVNKGQRMDVNLLAGAGTHFSIVGETEGETEYSFVTKKKNYKILVFTSQRMAVPFGLTVTVR